ncbi:MAG TPA: M20 family metallopeptidase [Dehalococcoidia bacterium]|nr:M20 family metallopeptidase [Dehalococcoidia bacterium]
MPTNDLLTAAKALRPSLVADRRSIHQHPELPYQEERTSALVAARLHELGIEHRTGIAETGVIGLIHGGRPGKTVLLRADMDALPIEEVSSEPYASVNRGVMHACGHDGHTAMLMAAARILLERRESLPGDIKLMFQPAEEGGAGALRMIEQGILEEPHVDAAFGIHLAGLHYVGESVINDGPAMAAADHLHIVIRGRGGHASMPHVAVDPIVVASHVILALQTMVSRESPPLEPAVVTIGSIQAGTTFNVIPDFAELKGTVRTFSAQLQEKLERRIPELVHGIAQAMGAQAEVEYGRLYPPTINHVAEAGLMRSAVADAIGPESVIPSEPVMGAEDFSYLLQRVPGGFGFVGVRKREWAVPRANHNTSFDMDEDALPIGAAILASTAIKFLNDT